MATRGRASWPDTRSAPQAEKVNFDIIILEQSPNYRFNRGLLLNAGVLLTHSLDHDYYVFNDVDTVPAKGSGIHYTYPEGARPLHITPPGMHPKYAHAEVRRSFSLLHHDPATLAEHACMVIADLACMHDVQDILFSTHQRLRAAILWRDRRVLAGADPGCQRPRHRVLGLGEGRCAALRHAPYWLTQAIERSPLAWRAQTTTCGSAS